ncbi:hypothetical protein Cfor_01739 [Coptotermes formosanus]|uniref:Amine oxidase domain-containing protein n=1 Tax=Coptotermes formosanus TaxID=36987 RepID=A0A6L2Q6D4_COPFO|nr:hypothetical protein Cfor_01739 [Coptotermes formosanus]
MAAGSGNSGSNRCKILIIGAGMAGLSAASHLVKNGVTDFKILEARNRIGGRIVSTNTGSHKIELGANWIHGVLGNPMYEIAMANGLIDIVHVPKPHKVVAATEDGKQIPFQLLQETYEAYVCFLRRCEEYFLCHYLPPTGISSVGEHIGLETALYLDRSCNDEDRHLRQLIFDCLLKRETCITGCHSMDEIDLIELGSYAELQGGNIVLPSGYSSILEPVSRDIPQGNICKRQAVATIHWLYADESMSANAVEHVPNVEIVCEDGSRYYADHVICTIPLGVLKEKAATLFSPSLPQYKLDSIDRLLFGTVDKILLEYERPFLNPDVSEVMLLWETDVDSDTDDLSNTWYRKIYSFSKMSETLLLGWISGREAEYMETLTHDLVAETCTNILRKFLSDPFVPKPKLCICTSWHKQPYTRGAYTAMAVGASQLDIEQIAQPLYANPQQKKVSCMLIPVVLFAGEHTHSSFYSTVHGAYLTGRSAAQVLLRSDSPQELVMECEGTSDLSSWIQGISLN